ncbi:MAG: hypothetical protein GY906_11350 [bacterium]|nr:hypothetical protein [bacterium]
MTKKRIPRNRLLRGLIQSGVATKDDIPEIERRLRDFKTAQAVNRFYYKNRGVRVIERLKLLADWIWKHREGILEILGFVIMFAEDGRPMLRDKAEVEAEELERVKKEKALAKRKAAADRKKAEAVSETPDGEKVEDFTSREEVLDELTTESERKRMYDIGGTGDDE